MHYDIIDSQPPDTVIVFMLFKCKIRYLQHVAAPLYKKSG